MLSPLDRWLYYLVTDVQIIGVVTWLGLLVTIGGFGIALAQISKIKRSSEAASDAVAKLVRIVRSQEQAAKITDALSHLRSAQVMIKQGNADAAEAYLSIGRSALIAARELTDIADDRLVIDEIVFSARMLLDDLSAPRLSRVPSLGQTSDRHESISAILDRLGTLSAKLNVRLAGIGRTS